LFYSLPMALVLDSIANIVFQISFEKN